MPMNNQTNETLTVYDRYPTNMDFRFKFLVITSVLHCWSMPIIIITGIIGNFISLMVWTKRKIRRNNSSATYLAALSFSDLIMLHAYTLYYLKFSWRISLIDYPIICQLFQLITFWFQYNPSPLVFAFTLERWIAVCYPLKRERWCTNKRAYMAIFVICLLMVPICMVQAFGWSTDNPMHVCAFKNSWQRSMFVNIFATVVEFLMSAGFPICALIFNILVIIELQTIGKNPLKHDLNKRPSASNVKYNKIENRTRFNFFKTRKTKHTPNIDGNDQDNAQTVFINTNTSNKRESLKTNPTVKPTLQVHKSSTAGNVNFRSTTIMLLTVSFYQIFTTLPTGAVYLTQFFIADGNINMTDAELLKDPQWQNFLLFQTLKEFVDLFALTHYSFNVLIYLLTGRQFRRYLVQTLKIEKLCYSNSDAITDQNSKNNQSQIRLGTYPASGNNNIIVNPHLSK